MKKYLLLAAATLVMTGASATGIQPRNAQAKPIAPALPELTMPGMYMQEAQMAAPGTRFHAPKKANNIEVLYYRPAGVYPAKFVMENGEYAGSFSFDYFHFKPYAEYTYKSQIDGATSNATLTWLYQKWGYDDSGNTGRQWLTTTGVEDLTLSYSYESDTVPTLQVQDGSNYGEYFMHYYTVGGTSSSPTFDGPNYDLVMAAPSFLDVYSDYGYDLLKSSKTFAAGGRNGDHYYVFTYYSGATAYGNNDYGWWFGKNASGIDGIGSAFEAPEHPYVLKNVYMYCAMLDVTRGKSVDLTCKVYRLPEMLDYDESSVTLDEEPGELIATGRCTVTSTTYELNNGMLTFTLYGEEDGLEYEVTPTIDYPILVTVEGYNDDSMSAITDFSALVSADMESDEGHGELAYVKYALRDTTGERTGGYVWRGLNNFFSSGEMKTGFSIFITSDLPFLTFNYNTEDGVYTFPDEGGVMEKTVYESGSQKITTKSIEFYSYTPSVDEGWTLTCNGGDVPEWLTIELSDGATDGEFNGLVNAVVTATALPEGVTYREATVRFEFPGAYLDYTFKQGVDEGGIIGDVNGDGEVSIADINAIIDLILNNGYTTAADVNGDGEVSIADVNAVVDIILANK